MTTLVRSHDNRDFERELTVRDAEVRTLRGEIQSLKRSLEVAERMLQARKFIINEQHAEIEELRRKNG